MFSAFRTIMQIRVSSGVNRLLYYLSRLPLLGRAIKDSVYSHHAFKRRLSAIVRVLSALWGIGKKALYVLVCLYLPLLLVDGYTADERLDWFLYALLWISFVVAPVSNAMVMEPKRDKYVGVKLMRIPARSYMLATLGIRYAAFIPAFVPVLTFFSMLLGAPWWYGTVMAAGIGGWRVAAEALHLALFQRRGVVLVKRNAIVWSVILMGYACAYAPLLLGWAPPFGGVVTHPVFAVLMLAAGAAGGLYLYRYPHYRPAVDAVSSPDEPLLDMGRMMQEAKTSAVMTKTADLEGTAVTAGRFEHLQGYRYLNALFFERHRHYLLEPLRKRLWGIGIGTLAAAAAVLAVPRVSVFAAGLQMETVLPALLVGLHFLAVGDVLCRAMFYNCDLSLLRYNFYREPEAIMEGYRIRLLRVTGFNLLLAGSLGAGLLLVMILAGAGWSVQSMLIFAGLALGAGVFFSVHHVSMYYMFQPYSGEMNVKNPLFTVTTIVISYATMFSFFLAGNRWLPALMAVILFVYSAAAVLLTRKLAPKQFRVK